MNEFQATAVLAALLALRCVAPFLLLMAIGYGMNRLVAHWEREEQAPTGAQAFISLPMVATRPAKPEAKIPCWVFNNCDEKTRNACPAYANPTLACWVARLRAEGRVPAKCVDCALYTGAPIMAVGD
jgi:hypothetical protein